MPGTAAFQIGACLLFEAGVCQLLCKRDASVCLGLTLSIDVVLTIFSIYTVAFLAYIVFDTEGRMHPQLTLWRVCDVLFAHLIGQGTATFALWKLHAVQGIYSAYTHTGDVGALYAAYDLLLYTINMLSGGGVIDNVPTTELARLLVSLQLAWNSITVLIVLSAAVATLAGHTDTFAAPSAS